MSLYQTSTVVELNHLLHRHVEESSNGAHGLPVVEDLKHVHDYDVPSMAHYTIILIHFSYQMEAIHSIDDNSVDGQMFPHKIKDVL
jgi:hypothetical protein